MAKTDEQDVNRRGFPALRAQLRPPVSSAPQIAVEQPTQAAPAKSADPTAGLIQTGARQLNQALVGKQAVADARTAASPIDRPTGARTLSVADINPRTGLPIAGLGYQPGNSLQLVTTERQPGPILIDPANPNFASLPRPPALNPAAPRNRGAATAPAPASATTRPQVQQPSAADIANLPVATAAPAPSLAELRANPAPNTFVGRNGVRTIDASGNVQQPLVAGTLNTVPSTAFTAPGIGAMGIPGGDRMGASNALSARQQEVTSAQARNAATNARANEFNASAIGDYRSKEGRAFAPIQSAMQDLDSAAFRASMQANNPGARGRRGQEMLSSLLQTKAGLAQAPFAAAAENGKATSQTAGAVQLSQQQGQNALAAANQQSQAQMQLEQFKQSVQPPTLFQSDQGYFQMDGGMAAPLIGPDGKQVKPAVQGVTTQLTPDALLRAYTEQAAAIQGGLSTPEEKSAATIQLQQNPMFAPLFGAPQQGAQKTQKPGTVQQFIERARASGSKLDDAALTAYYNQEYGT